MIRLAAATPIRPRATAATTTIGPIAQLRPELAAATD
jgi:hypothetical protein